MTPQELVAGAMLDRNQQANRLGIPQQMGAFANSLGMTPTPQQEALQEPLISPETYGIGTMLKKAAPMLPGALGMTVFHGSPHKFDKFDLSKIGSGEGAQAYGHGLYFAENPAVAKKYADPGNLYKVDLPDDSIANMLDYDKPLNQQADNVKNLFSRAYPGLANSTKTLDSEFPYGINKAHSDFLRSQGIPGIKYMDQGSRPLLDNMGKELMVKPEGGGRFGIFDSNGYQLDIPSFASVEEAKQFLKQGGTSNFVVFDDTLPKIVGKE
jgi:hypothetical protein